MDIFTKEKRSWIMGRIRSRNTKPEIIVRSVLHRLGFRFSLRRKDLPAHPDIVLPKHKTVVLVHGCFWHRHKACRTFSMPKSRKSFWKDKFDNNVRRDKKNKCELRKLGWNVIVLWECEVIKHPEKIAKRLLNKLTLQREDLRTGIIQYQRSDSQPLSTYSIPAKKELMRIAEKRADYSHPKVEPLHPQLDAKTSVKLI
jgi:DNA mismatch endonuclease (patch repair protein)